MLGREGPIYLTSFALAPPRTGLEKVKHRCRRGEDTVDVAQTKDGGRLEGHRGPGDGEQLTDFHCVGDKMAKIL